MTRFIAGEDRRQGTLLPDCLDDYVAADNPVRLVEVFVDELNLMTLGFARAVPEATGRPGYDPRRQNPRFHTASREGTATILQWRGSPRSQPRKTRMSISVSSRSVFARRCSRDTATLVEWMT